MIITVPSAPASTATPSAYSPPASAGSRPSTAKQGYMTGDHIITNLQPLFGSSTALRDASLRVMLKGQFHTRDSAYDALLSHNCVLKCAAEEEGKEPPAARLATLRRELSMYQAAQQLAKERGDVGTGCVRCFPVRPDTTYLVLEDHGNDLRALLAANPRSPQLVVEAVVQAVQALHSLGIMHGDIKPQNLLCSVTIAGHYVVKLCDLEGAYRVGDMCPASGTRYFMAPEVRIAAATAGLIQASLDKDMFPLGLVIWQVMRRTVIPALSCADDAVEAHLYADQSALNAHLQFHALYKPFMEQVVSINPVHRISISELSNHIRRLGSTSIMEDAVRREEDLQFLKQNVSSQLQSLNAKMDNLLIEVRSGFSALNGSVVEVADTLRQEVLSGGNRSQVLESMILAAEDSFSRLSEAASPSSQLQRSTPAAHGESIRVCLASMQERICASVAQTAQLHAEKCNREMQASLQTLAVQVNERFSGLSASVQEQINEQRHSTAAAAQQHETFAETSRCLAGSVKEMLDSLNHIREELAQLKSAQEQLGRQMGQVLRDNKELGNMLQTVISGTHSIPTLSIILPDVAKSWLQSHSPMRLVRHQYRLFFLCAHTHQIAPCGPKGKGYKITATKQWVIDAAPVLRVGLVLVKLALMASGLPLPVPDLCTALVGSAMHTKYLDAALQLVSQPPEDDLRSTEFSMEKTLSEIKRYEVGDLMVAQGATAGAAAAERHLQEGSRKAYETIQALLVKDGVNIPLTCGLRQVTHRGRTAWVLDNDATEAAWKESM